MRARVTVVASRPSRGLKSSILAFSASQVAGAPCSGASYGGIDQPTLEALALYGKAIARKAPGTANLVLDLSAVAQFDPDKAPQREPDEKRTYAELRNAYVAGMREIGMDRFVLASDRPAISEPAEYFAAERAALPVTDAEWRQLCANVAPYLHPDWVSGLNRHRSR